jgi:integrase
MSAAKLDAELLERFYARLRRCSKLCTGPARDHDCRPLSASSVRQIHFILRGALDRAVRWRYLGINEAALAEPPAFERREPDPPSAEEVADLLNEAWRDPSWGMLLWLTMVTGCRRGEMCALRWTDLDVVRGMMTVERSYAQTAQGTHEKETKSRQKRRVAIDAYTVELLIAYREQCEADCAAIGIKLARDAFVFSNSPDCSIALLPSTVTQKYRRLATRVGLRSSRLHSLRHYSATELLTAGVDLRTVSGRLGHRWRNHTPVRRMGLPRPITALPTQSATSCRGRIPLAGSPATPTRRSQRSCATQSRRARWLPAHYCRRAMKSQSDTTSRSAPPIAQSAC